MKQSLALRGRNQERDSGEPTKQHRPEWNHQLLLMVPLIFWESSLGRCPRPRDFKGIGPLKQLSIRKQLQFLQKVCLTKTIGLLLIRILGYSCSFSSSIFRQFI
mgnify:FL=1